MDKNKAFEKTNVFVPRIRPEADNETRTIVASIYLTVKHYVDWLYNNNYEIIDRTISEEEIAKIKKRPA